MFDRRAVLCGLSLVCVGLVSSGADAGGVIDEDGRFNPANGALSFSGFGEAVAIDGDRVLAGAWLSQGAVTGEVFVFDLQTGQQVSRLAVDGTAEPRQFGFSVAADDGVAVIGAPGDMVGGVPSGAAYVFDLSTGQQVFRLEPRVPALSAMLGGSVVIQGDTAFVGATGDEGAVSGSGAVYLFDLTTGLQSGRLVADDGMASDEFGSALAVAGDRVLVGAPGVDGSTGAVYEFSLATQAQVHRYVASDRFSGDRFGEAVAIAGFEAAIGAPLAGDAMGFFPGKVYMFDIDSRLEVDTVMADTPINNNGFGGSISVNDNAMLIGSFVEPFGTGGQSAYLFDRRTRGQVVRLVPSDPVALRLFGWSLALSGSTAVIGSANFAGPGVEDRLYRFDLGLGITEQPRGVVVSPGETATFTVGGSPALNTGYQWRRDGVPLVEGDGVLGSRTSTLEVVAFADDVGLYDCVLTNTSLGLSQTPGFFATTDPAVLGVRPAPSPCLADLTMDQVLDIDDVLTFLQAFDAGCP